MNSIYIRERKHCNNKRYWLLNWPIINLGRYTWTIVGLQTTTVALCSSIITKQSMIRPAIKKTSAPKTRTLPGSVLRSRGTL